MCQLKSAAKTIKGSYSMRNWPLTRYFIKKYTHISNLLQQFQLVDLSHWESNRNREVSGVYFSQWGPGGPAYEQTLSSLFFHSCRHKMLFNGCYLNVHKALMFCLILLFKYRSPKMYITYLVNYCIGAVLHIIWIALYLNLLCQIQSKWPLSSHSNTDELLPTHMSPTVYVG